MPDPSVTPPLATESSSPTNPLDQEWLTNLPSAPLARIDAVIAHYRRTRQPVQLFEALKMKGRGELGLPMVAPADEKTAVGTDAASRQRERAMEEKLLDACRQTGAMLIEDGRIAEGWMYLQPTGDKGLARRLIVGQPITEENYDEMVHVLVQEGVDIRRGYQAVLEHQGTCNSITLFDQAIATRSRSDRQAAAACLLDHFYDELLELVRQDFRQRGPDNGVSDDQIEADCQSLELGDLIARHRWILGGGGYHLDTTHLSSVVRFSTVLDDPNHLDRAIALCQYGRRLPPDFQYPGDEPFVDFYPAHLLFLNALRGRGIDTALRHFEDKARTVDVAVHGSGAIETYLDLLDRTGHPGRAIRAAMELFPSGVTVQQVLPEMLEIARRAVAKGDHEIPKLLEKFCFDRGELLGVAAAAELASV